MKLFLPVHGLQDCLKIQSVLNRLVDWCGVNSLEPNVGNHIFDPVKFVNILGGISLDRVIDLGIVMDSRMSFSRHIYITVRKALAILILLGHFMCHLCARSLSTQVVFDGLFMTCTLEWLEKRPFLKSAW
jgi:hypothetical protein